jgi:DNA-binding CsgD family transcriptional regulator
MTGSASAGGNVNDVVALRSKPRLLILDEELRIVFADWAAMFTILRLCERPDDPVERLPLPLDDAVREAIASWGTDAQDERVVEPLPDVVLRVSRLRGPSRNYVAVFCESRTRRDDLTNAARAFLLTKREQEVLGLVLQGFRPDEIADELVVPEAAVEDYLIQLLRKTKSQSRTEMISRVLGWVNRA